MADMLLDRMDQWAKKQPEKKLFTFLSDDGKETAVLTYGDMHARTFAIAKTLRMDKSEGGWGIESNDRVLLVYPPSLDFIVAFIACLRAGVVAVPVFPPHPGKLRKDLQHFASIHESSGAKVALTNTTYNWAKKVSGIKSVFSKHQKQWPDVRWILTDGKTAPGTKKDPASQFHVARGDLAFLQYTSGSTSEPKGVMISHNNLAHNLSTIVSALGASQATIVCAWLPQYHDMGLIGSYLGTLYCGGSGVYMSPFSFIRNPPIWIKMCSKYKATHTQAPNFAYKLTARKFVAAVQKETKLSGREPELLDLSSMKHMFNAAEPVTSESIDLFYDTFRKHGLRDHVIVPGYGLAEHTVYVCDGGFQRLMLDKHALQSNKIVELKPDEEEMSENAKILIGCGKPMFEEYEIDLRIVDVETRVDLGEDNIGEVWVRSPSMACGYFEKDDATEEAFGGVLASTTTDDTAPKKYLRTGDLGFLHKGELFICGRDKDLIIIRGGNHYPQDIEQSVESDDQIRPGCSAAFSVIAAEEEVLVVVTELRDAKNPNALEIAQRARQRVAQEHGVQVHTLVLIKPRTVEKTSSGKIARRWARKAYLADDLEVVVTSSGRVDIITPTHSVGAKTEEGKVKRGEVKERQKEGSVRTRFLDEVCNLAEIDPNELQIDVPLQALGLDSMVIEQIRGMVEGEFGIELETEELFDEACTLNNLIRKIENGGRDFPAEVGQGKGVNVIVPIDVEEEQEGVREGGGDRGGVRPPSTFEVIFCFCCRGAKKSKKKR